MASAVEFIAGKRYGDKIMTRPETYQYEPRVRNGGSRTPGLRQILSSLPKPVGRLEVLYHQCVEVYAQFGNDPFHPRFRELYDDFMKTLYISQITGFNIRGYTQLCVEDLFRRDLFEQRGDNKHNGGNGKK